MWCGSSPRRRRVFLCSFRRRLRWLRRFSATVLRIGYDRQCGNNQQRQKCRHPSQGKIHDAPSTNM
jgi:hypothetical protein